MHILISPNAFKYSVDAEDAALAIQKGLMKSKLKFTCECFPIGDGGDGTAILIIKRCGGELVNSRVQDPLGREINCEFGLIKQTSKTYYIFVVSFSISGTFSNCCLQ